MITNRVLGTVLLGINEQINCNDCVSAFGSAGSFSAGVHGRKNITDNLALLAGLAYTQYSEGGYSVTSAPIGAVALRYDFTDWGSSRPFFDIGTLLTPYEKVRYRRSYLTSLGAVTVEGNINGGYVYAFGTQSGIVAAVTGQGMVTPTIGNQGWFEYGGRLGFRISKGWVADVFVNGTLGPQPVGNTAHGGVGLRINY
jgi:hypothetical protein